MFAQPFPDPGRRADRHFEPDHAFEHRVLHQLEHHSANESALLEAYHEIAERSDTGSAVRFLIELILDDERRHHELFEQMANTFRSFMWELPVEPRLPAATQLHEPELRDATAQLLRSERRDRKELKALRSELGKQRGLALDELIVDLMLHDTEKHIAILKYIHDDLAR